MLNIFYLISSRGWGGMEMHPFVLARGLAERGHSVIFGLSAGSRMSRFAREHGFSHLSLPFRWYLDRATYAGLRRHLRKQKVDVLHLHYSRDAWQALLLAGIFRRRVPLVFTRHMCSPAHRPKTDPLHRILARRLDAMVAISGYVRRNSLLVYPIAEEKVRTVYYGLDRDVAGSPQGGRAVREKLGVGPEEILIGMAAQLSPNKRQDLFLDAAELLLGDHPQARFVLAGAAANRDYAEQIRSRAHQDGLAGRVILTGFWQDVPSLVQALDIATLTSRAEAFGLVMIEALANGRPFVGSRSGAVPEVIDHGRNGLLFEPGDPADLARAWAELVRDPQRRARIGEEGKKTFEERFTLEREVEQTEALYRSLIERSS
ncbi:MAG: glycosyltransferase family 4 protein [bacterium]